MASLRIQAVLDTIRNDNPFSRAASANMLSFVLSRFAIGNWEMFGASTPASSLEMLAHCIDRKLVVVPAEVEAVRSIFTRYLALGSIECRRFVHTRRSSRRDP